MEKRKITEEERQAHYARVREMLKNDKEKPGWCGTPKVMARMMREQEEASKTNPETQSKSNS